MARLRARRVRRFTPTSQGVEGLERRELLAFDPFSAVPQAVATRWEYAPYSEFHPSLSGDNSSGSNTSGGSYSYGNTTTTWTSTTTWDDSWSSTFTPDSPPSGGSDYEGGSGTSNWNLHDHSTEAGTTTTVTTGANPSTAVSTTTTMTDLVASGTSGSAGTTTSYTLTNSGTAGDSKHSVTSTNGTDVFTVAFASADAYTLNVTGSKGAPGGNTLQYTLTDAGNATSSVGDVFNQPRPGAGVTGSDAATSSDLATDTYSLTASGGSGPGATSGYQLTLGSTDDSTLAASGGGTTAGGGSDEYSVLAASHVAFTLSAGGTGGSGGGDYASTSYTLTDTTDDTQVDHAAAVSPRVAPGSSGSDGGSFDDSLTRHLTLTAGGGTGPAGTVATYSLGDVESATTSTHAYGGGITAPSSGDPGGSSPGGSSATPGGTIRSPQNHFVLDDRSASGSADYTGSGSTDAYSGSGSGSGSSAYNGSGSSSGGGPPDHGPIHDHYDTTESITSTSSLTAAGTSTTPGAGGIDRPVFQSFGGNAAGGDSGTYGLTSTGSDTLTSSVTVSDDASAVSRTDSSTSANTLTASGSLAAGVESGTYSLTDSTSSDTSLSGTDTTPRTDPGATGSDTATMTDHTTARSDLSASGGTGAGGTSTYSFNSSNSHDSSLTLSGGGTTAIGGGDSYLIATASSTSDSLTASGGGVTGAETGNYTLTASGSDSTTIHKEATSARTDVNATGSDGGTYDQATQNQYHLTARGGTAAGADSRYNLTASDSATVTSTISGGGTTADGGGDHYSVTLSATRADSQAIDGGSTGGVVAATFTLSSSGGSSLSVHEGATTTGAAGGSGTSFDDATSTHYSLSMGGTTDASGDHGTYAVSAGGSSSSSLHASGSGDADGSGSNTYDATRATSTAYDLTASGGLDAGSPSSYSLTGSGSEATAVTSSGAGDGAFRYSTTSSSHYGLAAAGGRDASGVATSTTTLTSGDSQSSEFSALVSDDTGTYYLDVQESGSESMTATGGTAGPATFTYDASGSAGYSLTPLGGGSPDGASYTFTLHMAGDPGGAIATTSTFETGGAQATGGAGGGGPAGNGGMIAHGSPITGYRTGDGDSQSGGSNRRWGQTVGQWWSDAYAEARRVPNTVYYFPRALVIAVASGQSADGVLGTVNGATGALNPIGGGIPFGPLYGNPGAYADGQSVGRVTSFFMNMVLTVSGARGVVTGIQTIQTARGPLQLANLLLSNGQTVQIALSGGRAIVVTPQALIAAGLSTAAVSNLWRGRDMARAFSEINGGPGNPAPGGGGQAPNNFSISDRNLQKVFSKHGGDFGLTGNWNPSRAAELRNAIQSHLNNPGVQHISGTYRGMEVTHVVDPTTGLNVILDKAGNLVGGWKLGAEQLESVLRLGRLF